MVQKFLFEQSKKDAAVVVKLEGDITEESNFGKVDLKGINSLQLETAKVQYINSAGVSNWVSWVRQAKQSEPNVQLILCDVPYVLVKQVTGVSGFIPDGTKIRSLIVPYCCDTCNKVEEKLFRADTDFSSGISTDNLKKNFETTVVCAKCQFPMTLDASFKIYQMMISKYC